MGRPTGPFPQTVLEAENLMDLIRVRQGRLPNYIFDLAGATRLTEGQVEHRIQVIKDILADQWDDALCFNMKLGYHFADHIVESTTYSHMRLAIARKQMARLLTGTVIPALSAFGGNKALKTAKKDIERVVEDLVDLELELA